MSLYLCQHLEFYNYINYFSSGIYLSAAFFEPWWLLFKFILSLLNFINLLETMKIFEKGKPKIALLNY